MTEPPDFQHAPPSGAPYDDNAIGRVLDVPAALARAAEHATIDDLRTVQRAAWDTGYATGREDGRDEERERCTRAVSTIFARCFAGEPVTVADCDALMNAVRSGKDPSQ